VRRHERDEGTKVTEHPLPLLSKSRFIAGLQCLKRLYLECFNRELADDVTEQQQEIFDSGTEVGVLARDRFPGGVLIREDYFDHEGAVASTLTALASTTVSPLYEAAFVHDGVRIRADVLVPSGGGLYNLIEVKSTSRVKDEHRPDVGIQWYVLKGAGIPLRHAGLCHLNTSYVYEGGEYDLRALFSVEDVTPMCEALQAAIPRLLAEMRRPLAESEPPPVRTGQQCSSPYRCPFYGHCHAGESQHHISQLPRATVELIQSLEKMGIEDIRDIPEDFRQLNPLQFRVRECVATNRMYLDPSLSSQLRHLRRPLHFMDFETFNPALPRYAGTRPYQVVPFQWSVHTLDEDGALRHQEFLHDRSDDPRPAFAASLLRALGDTGPVIVYSGYEGARLRELARAIPSLAQPLNAVADGRLVDLLQLVRTYCYHPEFHGSFSIKAVLPALVPSLGYDDLAIGDGTLAAAAYAEMSSPAATAERRAELRANLLAYCERDTLAEVELFRFFTK
jgi:predicted RecB family nuclease